LKNYTNAHPTMTMNSLGSMSISQDLGFRSKLVFENLLFITPQEMESAIGLDFKLPNYADMVHIILNKAIEDIF
jgi:hypothetical protein